MRPDTFGDLVLFAPALADLMAAWPEAKHTIVVRPGYESLAPLFPEGLHWVVSPINPFKVFPAKAREDLTTLFATLEIRAPDLVVASTLSRTWLEVAVGAKFPQARRVALGNSAVDPLFVRALQLELGIDAASVFTETVAVEPGERDAAANARLVSQLVGHPAPARLNGGLSVPTELRTAATAQLAALGLPTGGFAAVFAAGLANVPIKAWPTERFGQLVAWLQRDHGLPVLLLGHESEAAVLSAVQTAVGTAGGRIPPVWLGRDGEMPALAALLEQARLYVGHDTGAMHLAAQLGRPTVGIFGGGHWPRFRPAGPQVVTVVHPLPCFGCGWDCQFGDAPCVKAIALTDVQRAVSAALAAGTAPLDLAIEANTLAPEVRGLVEAVTPRYRALQADRLERQHTIESMKDQADTKDAEIADLKRAADERKTEMEAIKAELEAECATKDTEITELKGEADTKDAEIAQLKHETDGKDVEIAALKGEANTKDAEIASLKGEANTKDAEIDSIKQIANEREALVIKLDGFVKHFQKAVAEKDAHIGNLDTTLKQRADALASAGETARQAEAALAAALARVAEVETILQRLPGDAPVWAQALHDKDVHIRNLDALIHHLRGEIAAREGVISNYAANLHALEGAKHYAKLLAEKEAVIQVLHKACVEREKVIQGLATQATGVGPSIVKLWQATRAWWALKVATPFDTWLFKQVVESYWMQIGVLRHHDPKPVVWDKMPAVKTPNEKLPQIGIVTPSYGQDAYVESTMLSVLDQRYPKLLYVVQDGGSKDRSAEIIARYEGRLAHWESKRDRGQADAVVKGFKHIENRLGPDDLMAWLNSDDLLAPRSLRTVADYFARHPDVDVVYGHRIIIDTQDRDVGRWIMPRHEPESLHWIDYVPQETMFWRKRAWDQVGGVDPTFQFALDWDLLARFTQANCKIVRLPYFLGCFRVHSEQKTSQAIHTTGAQEMEKVRRSFHGENANDFEKINAWARRVRFQGAVTARLHALGIRW